MPSLEKSELAGKIGAAGSESLEVTETGTLRAGHGWDG